MQQEASAGGVTLGSIGPRESSRRFGGFNGSTLRSHSTSVAIAAAAFFAIAGLASASAILGAAAAIAVGLTLSLRYPGLLLALALNGFFVYLAVLDVAGRGTATLAYDIVLAVLLLLAAWRGRAILAGRLRARGRLESVWLAAAGLLALWFVVNGLLYRIGGHEARVLMGLLILLTLPSLTLALSLDERGFADLRRWIIALGLGMVLAEIVAAAVGPALVDGRLSAIDRLDPISGGLVPALAAAAVLSIPARAPLERALQLLLLATLVAGTVTPGSRGPVVALVVTIVLGAIIAPRRIALVAVVALAVGLPLGYAGAKAFGTDSYLGQAANDVVGDSLRGGEISSISMRRYWIRSALSDVPDKPILGHGLVALRDTSPDAYRMGVGGALRYPHNDLVESIYSLGIPGLVLFLLLISLPAVAGYRLVRRARGTLALLAAMLFVFAFVESNFSGEIGADHVLWASAGLLVALSLDRRRAV
jgi:O-antigen ligase